jgi:hypothetical protein
LLTQAGKVGNLTRYAHLAALAVEHGAVLCLYNAITGSLARLPDSGRPPR